MLPQFPTPNAVDYPQVCRVLVLPAVDEILSAVSSALTLLGHPTAWEQVGTMGEEEAAQIIQQAISGYFEDRCMIGSIFAHAAAVLPAWAVACDGAILNRADYPALYDAIDPSFRIDGLTFRVPDLRGRSIIGTGDGPLTTPRLLNEEGGAEKVVLQEVELPAHTHTAQPHTHTDAGHAHGYTGVAPNIDLETPGVPDITAAGILPFQTTGVGSANIQPATVTIEPTGANEPHANMHPYLALHYAMVAR